MMYNYKLIVFGNEQRISKAFNDSDQTVYWDKKAFNNNQILLLEELKANFA